MPDLHGDDPRDREPGGAAGQARFRLRLTVAMLAFAAGATAVVIAILLVKSALG